MMRLQAFCQAMLFNYEKTGYVIRDLQEFGKTEYYPYCEPPEQSLRGRRLKITPQNVNGKIRWNGIILDYRQLPILQVNQMDGQDFSYRLLSPHEQTRRLLSAYIAGVEWWLEHRQQIRSFIEKGHAYPLRSRYAHLAVTPKAASPRPFTGSLPRNNTELTMYLDWLCSIQGSTQLVDGWRRPFRFKVSRGFFVGISAGADEEFGTKDDIIAKAKLRPL